MSIILYFPQSVKYILSCIFALSSDLWGVVNNAAVNGLGELEWISLDTFKSVTDVNLWGNIRVIQAFLPFIRRCKGEAYLGQCGSPSLG